MELKHLLWLLVGTKVYFGSQVDLKNGFWLPCGIEKFTLEPRWIQSRLVTRKGTCQVPITYKNMRINLIPDVPIDVETTFIFLKRCDKESSL